MNPLNIEKRIGPQKAAFILAALLLVGLLLRVGAILLFPMGPNTYSDDNGYLVSGITFLRTGYVAYADPHLQTSAIGPGMPVVLGMLLHLTGTDARGLVAAHMAFSCFGLLTAVAAYLLGEMLCSRGAGLLAAALCALDPSLISMNILFLTESPYMCLNLFAMYGFVRCTREWNFKSYWLGIACMCAAALFKGLALLVAVAAVAVLVRRRVKLSRVLSKAAVAALAFVLLFIPWWVRNGSFVGQFVPFTTNRGDIQLMATFEGIGCPEGTYEEAVLQADKEAWEQGYQDDVVRRFERRGEMGRERMAQWFQEAPLGLVVSQLIYKPLKLTLGHMNAIDLLPDQLMILWWWACLLVAIWGLICPRWGGRASLGYYAPAVYLLVATMVTAFYVPLARYGIPHVPIWLFYTAAGGSDLVRRGRDAIKSHGKPCEAV